MKSAALILIDIQEGFRNPVWGMRSNPDFERSVAFLLDQWRRLLLPIIHIQHHSREFASPLRPHQPGVDFMLCARPNHNEPVLSKSVHSAFIGTTLEKDLRDREIENVVLIGLTADHCVSTTARMAHDLGFHVTIPIEAVATFDRLGSDGAFFPAELVHQVSLASLAREFADVLPLSDIARS